MKNKSISISISISIRNIAGALALASLAGCSGSGSCAPTTAGSVSNLSLKIEAPMQYPAGVPVTAYLTMTNTSKVNGNNLVYTVPSETNYTGVTITTDPTGAGQNCSNIAAGASCTFTALIPANSKPGSFTVLATPNSTNLSIKTATSDKSIQAASISVTANLGLVDTPNFTTPYYILPSSQVIPAANSTATTVYVSVLLKQIGEGLNSFKLVDETGANLSYSIVGTAAYTANSVNTYVVTIPAGKSVQHILAQSNVCSSDCSNDALVTIASQGTGILAIQPNYFQMTESYTSQDITLSNVGTGTISQLTMPAIGVPFSVESNTCSSTLAVNASCTLKVVYTPSTNSGQGSFVANYNNGSQIVNTSATIPYVGTSTQPYAILTLSPSSFSLNESHPLQRIIVQNTGTAAATALSLPTLTAPLQESTTVTSCTTNRSLAINESCTYDVYIDYTQSTQSAGSESVTFGYNNGQQTQTVSSAADWSSWKFWTLISGGTNQPVMIQNVFGSPTPQNIVATDENSYLWTYVNGTWTQLCNGQAGTPEAGQVIGLPTTNNIVWSTSSGELWTYQSGKWSKILDSSATETTPAGSSFGGFAENSTPTMIVGTDFSNYQLWLYNNGSWQKLTGSTNQPANAHMLSKGGAESNAITVYDNTGDIWFYNGTTWSKIGDAAANTPPNPNASTTGGTFYGVSTANSILYTASLPDYTHPLWVYNGSSWTQYNGANISGTPVDVATIFGTPSNNSLISRDNHLVNETDLNNYSIWTYVSGTWTNMTTGDGSSAPQYGWLVFGSNAAPDHFFMSDLQSSANLWEWYGSSWTKKTGATGGPQYVGFVAGNPTHNSFVMSDNNSQLWTYVNGKWSNITSHTDEPASVNNIYGLANPDSIVSTVSIPNKKGAFDLWVGKR